MVPTFYKGTSQWKHENKGSWRDNSFSESTINLNYYGLNLLSVICVRKEINGNNATCEDIDECEIGYCGFGTCSNSRGSYSCTCPDNFVKGDGNHQCKECKDGFELENGLCLDINECDDYDCGKGECKNNLGSYSCDCFDGFVNLTNDQSQICGKLI